MISNAQVAALVTLHIYGGRVYQNGSTFVRETGRTLRKTTVDALVRAGLVDVQESEDGYSRKISVSAAGVTALAEHAPLVEAERIRRRVRGEHRVDYRMYSRGNSPIRGWGRTSMGCRVTCSCGWGERDNSGRKSAEGFYAWHLSEAVNAQLEAAGLPADPDPED